MRNFRIKIWMVLAALLVLLAISFFATFFLSEREGTGAEKAVGAVAAPAVGSVHRATSSVKEFFLRLFALRDIDKEYEQLKEQNAALQLENWLMSDLQKENESLTGLLGFKDTYKQFEYLPARVVGSQPGNWFINITLDKGSTHGVKKDMNVVTAEGLVGRVVEVGPRWCKVMTLLDRQSAVSAMIERSRDAGFVQGPGDPQSGDPKCSVQYLNYDIEVMPGDRVLTSDNGGVFKKGIPVGTITEVSRDPNNPYALLTPSVNFSSIENVLIIKGGREVPTEKQIAQDQKDAASQQSEENQDDSTAQNEAKP